MAHYTFDASFEKKFVDVCLGAESMAQAAWSLGMNYKTLCFHAKRLSCFKANQAGKGFKKKSSREPIPMSEIFTGVHQTYQTHKVKKRLLSEGYKLHKRESCGLSEWLSKPIPLELHHINGVKTDNA